MKSAIIFFTIGSLLVLLSFFTEEWKGISIRSLGIGQFAASVVMFSIYFYENKKQYLSLKEGVLTKNTLFPIKIKLSEIQSVKAFAGDLKLKTLNREFVIDTQIIDTKSLEELRGILDKTTSLNQSR